MSKEKNQKVLRMDTMNPYVKAMEYAVRGPIVMRANEIELDLREGNNSYPFEKIVKSNIGDCHATGQKPITFIRQLMALCLYPEYLMNDPNFPSDCKERANRILNDCRGKSVGSYSNSEGLQVIREDVTSYIEARDGFPASPDNIIMTTGASDGIKIILNMLMTGEPGKKRAGIMIPVPQYPLYSATITEYNAYPIYYYLDEDNNWALNLKEVGAAYNKAKLHCQPRAICVINPGNPTGQVLTKENICDIIKFAKQEKLFILADEVYQHNIYADGLEFHSFKKVLTEMGPEYSNVELASFMSASKGYMGECGFRGGYCELTNIDPDAKKVIMKSITARLCPPLMGQIAIAAVVNPPVKGEPSYDLFMKEKTFVLSQLQKKARLVTDTFKSIQGFTCNEVQGAMYCFPRINIPEKAITQAKQRNMTPDSFYCYELLENTGICVIPGSGFGQRAGTYHFRITILPPEEEFNKTIIRFKEFHMNFLAKYH
ncbi:alanine aminotransferase 2-like [Octopus vulgaris]|uniref:alanine transaminase n=1 Tax=Octopus vulgaris TaxID=6645 RepID=A0AA36AUR7_OCTVU|nr:alanine aminotransferase 2-like [Octopus vulgaris]